MANRILVPCFPKRKLRSPAPLSRVTQRPSISREKLLSQISNHEIHDLLIFSKSPYKDISKHSSSIFSTKEFPSSTPRVMSHVKKANKRRKASSKKSISKSSLLTKFIKKAENMRYGNLSFEESCKNITRLTKLELPKKSLGFIEDSYQYSTAESRKKNFYKVSLDKQNRTPEPPKTPPPFSILSKIKAGSIRRSSSRKYK